jgi:isocitrate dehydrogenase kinase/phosphatase
MTDRAQPSSPDAERAAAVIHDAFNDYNEQFGDISRRGRRRFEQGDRAGMHADAMERLALYDHCIRECHARLEQRLGGRLLSRSLWTQIHRAYAVQLGGKLDAELYKTFFNSLSRRLFRTRGVDPAIEFIALDIEPGEQITHPVTQHHFAVSGEDEAALQDCWRRILHHPRFRCSWRSRDEDARRLSLRLMSELSDLGENRVHAIELLEPVFYRDGRAWLVGRVLTDGQQLPCVVALSNDKGQVHADALLTDARSLSVLFGYTHNYFLADLPTVTDTVLFLKSLLPGKPLDELYTILGRIKQGKTERYRHFFRHLLDNPNEQMQLAEGTPGLVMVVFTLPSYPLVFKLIRDRFGPEKPFGRRHVMEKYQLVFSHERGGRLVDAQSFRDLRFPRKQLSEELLEELQQHCQRSIQVDQDSVTIRYCYVERRVRPLNLFLREIDEQTAAATLKDYGQAIVDLAAANIFPGDLLLKNFGVTRTGRVIFYDYDELSLLTDCRFRRIPPSRSDEEELSAETTYAVESGDVFPEQFPRFMGLKPSHMSILEENHGRIFDWCWWREQQQAIREGRLDRIPYPSACRL